MKATIFRLLGLGLAVVLAAGCSLLNPGSPSVFEEETLSEINFMRTQPAVYAEQRLVDEYNAGTDEGAYNALKSAPAVEKLQWNSALLQAARVYAQYMADNDHFDHYDKQGRSPGDRAKAAGYEYGAGENIAAGSSPSRNANENPAEAARIFVEQFAMSEGHRNNIMNGSYKVLGIGFGRNVSSTYDNYTAQKFGRTIPSEDLQSSRQSQLQHP